MSVQKTTEFSTVTSIDELSQRLGDVLGVSSQVEITQ